MSTFGVMFISAVNRNSCSDILTTRCIDDIAIRIKDFSFAITLHDIYLSGGVDVHLRITFYQTFLAATKNIADGADGIVNFTTDGLGINFTDTRNIRNIAELLRYFNSHAGLITFHHVDVYLSVCIGLSIETTAINIVDTSG